MLDINVDESTNGGAILGAVGSPLLASALRSSARVIPSPISPSSTVYDDWLEHHQISHPTATVPAVGNIGTGSDYTVMLDHLGIPCLDIVFNQKSAAVYPYHSNYDSYHWVDKFGDPGFKKHLAMARLWGVLAVKLASGGAIPFQAVEYSEVLVAYAEKLAEETGFEVRVMLDSLEMWKIAAERLDAESKQLSAQESRDMSAIATVNKKYMSIERGFLNEEGLPGRTWFKHIVSPLLVC